MKIDRSDSLTTQQVAKVLRVSSTLILKWFNAGMFGKGGWRVPMSTHRRFTREAINRFAEQHGMPVYWEDLDNG